MLTLKDMEELARHSGEILLGHFGRVKGQRKADRSLVSEADQESEAFLLKEVEKREPGLVVLAEETHALTQDLNSLPLPNPTPKERMLVIDPLDGTASFLGGMAIWGVSIGLMEDGVPTMGVLYFPLFDEMYTGSPEGAFLNHNELPHATEGPAPDARDLTVSIPSNFHHYFQHRRPFPGKLRSLCSTAYHLAMVARGAVDGAFLYRSRLWDLAGGMAICRQLGYEARHLNGDLFKAARFQEGARLRPPMVLTRPDLFDTLHHFFPAKPNLS